MKAREFFDLVSRMRDSQKEYFRTRSNAAMTTSKQLESQVDKEIARVMEILKTREQASQPQQQKLDFN